MSIAEHPSATDFDIADPAHFDNGIPHHLFDQLRAHPGLAWNKTGPYGSGFWSVTRLADLVEVSRNAATYSSEEGHIQIYDIDDDVRDARASMIDLDAPTHTRLRRLVSKVFTPRHVQAYAPAISDRVKARLDRVQNAGQVEWVSALAAPIPIGVICDIMGVPSQDEDYMVELSDYLAGGTGSKPLDPTAYGNTRPLRELPFNSPAAHGIDVYARDARKRVLSSPGDDLLSKLAVAEIDGEPLTESEFARFFQLMIFAGNETTRSAMSFLAIYMAKHPEEFEKVRRDRTLLPQAVEEVVRCSSPILYFRRTAIEDTVLSGTEVKAGDKVVMWYSAANFDPDYFEDPHEFRVERAPVPANVAFGGGGPHFCLGAALARLELSILLEEILDRDLVFTVAGDPSSVHSNFVNGVESLDVSVTTR